MTDDERSRLRELAAAATPGPWRWEFNRSSKSLHLVGGRPRYDLTIMDFARWGMSRAVAVLRDPAVDGMNLLHRLCDRPDWIAPFPGRAHHADWCANVTHPDMQMIAAANPAAILALLDERDRLMAERDAWKEQLWALARALNCLPSTFVDANAHVYRAAEKVIAERDTLAALLRDLVQLEAAGRTEYESSIEHWERARAALEAKR